MKLYYCRDTDRGNGTYIVAEDIKKAIDLFEKEFGYVPEIIQYCLADHEHFIIQEKN